MKGSEGLDGDFHGCACCYAVIDEDYGFAGNSQGSPTLSVNLFSTQEFLGFFVDDGLLFGLGDAAHTEDIVVPEDDSTGGCGTHCEFFVTGESEFADDKYVQGKT